MTARASEAAPRGRPVPAARAIPTTRGSTLAAALACAAAVGFGVYAEEGRRALGRSWDVALLDLIAGLVFVGAGAAVFLWRPANRCWWLLVASGATWFLGTLAGVGDDDLAMVGFVTISWHYYFLAHLLLAFPTGRLTARRDAVLLAAIAAVLTMKSLVRLLLYVPPDGTGCQCVQNRFSGVEDRRWYDLAESAFPWVISILFALVVAEVVLRWARSSGAGRRMLTPVLIMSAAVAAQIAYSQVIRQELAWAVVRSQDLFVLVVGLRAIAAYSIVVGLRRTGRARAAVAGAVSELDADPARLTAALRSALDDPSLEVLPASSDAVPSPPPGRAVTVIEGDHGPLAALVHDEALLEDPGLISAVTAAIRLTTDNERLRRELQERLDELAASRVRIITAADAERRRIERDLHDGTQQRLISIALQLRLALARTEDAEDAEDPNGRRSARLDTTLRTAVDELADAVEEVRTLARGIHPAILTDAGLQAALESLVDRSSLNVRTALDVAVEPSAGAASAAYFCVSEALTNIAKHAHASDVVLQARSRTGAVEITIADDGVGGAAETELSSGLSGMRDRLAAVGGSLAVESPPGGGTRVRVVVPCV